MCISVNHRLIYTRLDKNPTCFMDVLDDFRVEKIAKELKELLALCCKSVITFHIASFMELWNDNPIDNH